ncbi:hypothetical protein R3P38DRAFT_3214049 [Favolaschia claudopus]|uniref:Uncharacterized protein n=1 Tax=Favolaschia claudopus TaxID=2862362 RepID=A0AAW0ABS5_9AGAR
MASDSDDAPPASKNAVWIDAEIKALFTGLDDAKSQKLMSGNGFRTQGWTVAVKAVAAANPTANPKKDEKKCKTRPPHAMTYEGSGEG